MIPQTVLLPSKHNEDCSKPKMALTFEHRQPPSIQPLWLAFHSIRAQRTVLTFVFFLSLCFVFSPLSAAVVQSIIEAERVVATALKIDGDDRTGTRSLRQSALRPLSAAAKAIVRSIRQEQWGVIVIPITGPRLTTRTMNARSASQPLGSARRLHFRTARLCFLFFTSSTRVPR